MKKYFVFIILTVKSLECFSQHQAHIHGVGNLTLVYEEHQLLVEIETPAANMLGFENEPRSEEEVAILTKVKNLVNDPSMLFSLDSSCESTSVEVDMPFDEEQNSRDHDEHEHSDNDAYKQDHQDFRLSYQWRCDIQKLSHFQTHIFEQFPGFESISAQWIVNGKQGASQLDKSNSKLDF